MTTEEVPLLGRRRCHVKRPPPEGLYEHEPEPKVAALDHSADEPSGTLDSSASPEPSASALEPSAPDLGFMTEDKPIETNGENETQAGVENLVEQTTFPAYEDMSCEEETVAPTEPSVSTPPQDGAFFETPGYDLPYVPVPHWKQHLKERNKSRNAVSAQRATTSSKFGKMLARKRPPSVRDVFVAEIQYLQALEQHCVKEGKTEQSLESLQWAIHWCDKCNHQHKRLLALAGVTELLRREELPDDKKKKKYREWKLKEMTPDQLAQFKQAMNKEWKSFLDLYRSCQDH